MFAALLPNVVPKMNSWTLLSQVCLKVLSGKSISESVDWLIYRLISRLSWWFSQLICSFIGQSRTNQSVSEHFAVHSITHYFLYCVSRTKHLHVWGQCDLINCSVVKELYKKYQHHSEELFSAVPCELHAVKQFYAAKMVLENHRV